MRIGVISDTHIPVKAKEIPQEIIKAFKGIDMILHAGDIVEESVLSELKKLSKDVRAVLGNMDSPELEKILPKKDIIKVNNVKIGLIHGYGRPDQLPKVVAGEFANDKVDIVIFGHSHTAMNEKIDGVLYFNPGSATDRVFAEYNSYGIIEINGKIKSEIIKI